MTNNIIQLNIMILRTNGVRWIYFKNKIEEERRSLRKLYLKKIKSN